MHINNYTGLSHFGSFWAILGPFLGENPLLHVLKMAKHFFNINETLFLGLHTFQPYFIACP